jgi:hypothetical protein
MNESLIDVCVMLDRILLQSYSDLDSLVESEEVLAYVSSVLQQIYTLCSGDTAAGTPQYYESGQVLSSRKDEVISQGNLREKMTMLMNLKQGPENIVWKLLLMKPSDLPSNINQSVLAMHRKRMTCMTGLHNITESTLEIDPSLLTRLPYLVQDGAVLLSRFSEFTGTPLRTVRPEDERRPFQLRMKDVKPPLSCREIEFIETKTGIRLSEPDDIIPWVTGQMYWKLNEDTFYAKLAKTYGHETITGPSSSTDTALMLMELFNGFDVRLATLACVGWLVPCQHHSMFEVFLSAIPYGLEYDTTQNTHTFLSRIKGILHSKHQGH